MNISSAFILGGSGYLGTAVRAGINHNWIMADLGEIQTSELPENTEVWDFACPGDDFWDRKDQLLNTLERTRALVNICRAKKYKLVYASSLGASEVDTSYGYQKVYNALKVINETLVSELKDYSILEIPRVYSLSRPHGLVRKLIDGTFVGDAKKEISFITLKDFVETTKESFLPFRVHYKTQKCRISDLLSTLKNVKAN